MYVLVFCPLMKNISASQNDSFLQVHAVAQPVDYFRRLIDTNMLKLLVDQTNLYYAQCTGKGLGTTVAEIEAMIGLYFRMGVVQIPHVRGYWESDTRYPPVADVMPRNRFETLMRHLHIVNNCEVSEDEKKSRLWKINPWISLFRNNCLKVAPEECHAVDEMMIPFRGRSILRQHIHGKPNPWGFKVWVRAGKSGYLYDLEVYEGASAASQIVTHSLSSDIVIRLSSSLASDRGYKLAADNFFTSEVILRELRQRGINFVGAVRSNRLRRCPLKDEESLKKERRGSYDMCVRKDEMVALRWIDCRCVTLLSTYVAAEPLRDVRRYDKKMKRFIQVSRPAIVGEYNSFMGGVDIQDSLCARYKYSIRSTRWYMYILYHTFTIAMVNAWLCYKRDCKKLGEKPSQLRVFQTSVASSLIYGSKAVRFRVERSPSTTPPCKVRRLAKVPVAVSTDGVGHLPEVLEKRRRCKVCSALSFISCLKCDVSLCLNKDRNCYAAYHQI